MNRKNTKEITNLILEARKVARQESKDGEAAFTTPITWPVNCTVGPGLEGAIACESKVGYVNGSKGELIYRGYDVFDLCAYSTFEEVSYLLIHGYLPSERQLAGFTKELVEYRSIPETMRRFMGFPIEKMNSMAALSLGANLMRSEFSYIESHAYKPDREAISADEDSIPMETKPMGEKRAIYEFKRKRRISRPKNVDPNLHSASDYQACMHLISGVASVAAAVARIKQGLLPIDPDPTLGHAANLIYMITGRKPTAIEERIMDIALILHADHGMNASTFATMVVASTLSDMFFAIGSGIAALNGPLHGGANEQVLMMLDEIGSKTNAKKWYKDARKNKKKIMGFGHRVYKAYDPRARILGPLAEYLIKNQDDQEMKNLFSTAQALETEVIETLGKEKGIFPNVDFYSGLVYSCLGIPDDLFTPIFAVSRVSGWTARMKEYLQQNRIFRPRAAYIGSLDEKYVSIKKRIEQE